MGDTTASVEGWLPALAAILEPSSRPSQHPWGLVTDVTLMDKISLTFEYLIMAIYIKDAKCKV
jgi:hypothetical protein